MSNLLPYFQFEPARWASGMIKFCSLAAKGYFMDIQCIYWQRECKMTESELRRWFPNNELVDELIKEEVIKIKGDHVLIEYLIGQKSEISNRSKANSKNGALGAEKRWAKKREKIVSPTPSSVPLTANFFYIGTKLHKYPVSKYVTSELQNHTSMFMPIVKPVKIEDVLKEMDVIYCGKSFTNHNHIINAFDKTARDLHGKNKKTSETPLKATKPQPFKHE